MLEINPTSGDTHRRGREVRRIAAGDTSNSVENQLSIPETDPERIAFNLWNEGKVDEAIQFLEREILARQQTTGEVKPVSDWRDRHRSLGSADFNAFGSTARTIDLVAGPADAIVPHPPRRKMRPVWIMGICLAVIGVSSAAALWSSRAGAPEETALAAIEPTLVKSEPVTAPAAKPKPKPYIAAVGADTDATTAKPAPVAAASADANANVPPPDEDALASDTAPDQVPAPETTASIAPAPTAVATPATTESAPIIEARLPRQRPEPPPQATQVAHVDEQDPPIVYAPPSVDDAQASYDLPSDDAPPHYFDPNNPPPRLTPAEYQALLERRAWAENYVSRRRAYAERRARIDDTYVAPGALAPFMRLRED